MKYTILLLAVVISACSTTQSPPPGNESPFGRNLLVTDTLDFGSVALSTSRDTTLRFQNTGSDTIVVTSESLSKSSFTFTDTAQTHFAIPPEAIKAVAVRFTAKDTSAEIAFDTVRSNNYSFIVTLRSSARPFSRMFFSAPLVIAISLNRLIGKDTNYESGPNPIFNFDIAAGNIGEGQSSFSQSGDTLIFISVVDNESGDPVYDGSSEQEHDEVWLVLDTIRETINWLKATSAYSKTEWWSAGKFRNDYERTESLVIHGVGLTKGTTTWSGMVTGSALLSIVDSAHFDDWGYGSGIPQIQGTLVSITGYDSTSSLSISIH